MTLVACREHGRGGAVVQFASALGTVLAADEITEVGAQGPVAQRLAVHHVDVLLAVDVLELGIPQANQRALVVEGVFAAGEVEPVGGEGGAAIERHVFHAGVVARAVATELAGIQGQPGDLLGGELAAAEGLWQ